MTQVLKRYDTHPCIICGQHTTLKTYCKTHLAAIKRPQFTLKSTKQIYSEMEHSQAGQRRESYDRLR